MQRRTVQLRTLSQPPSLPRGRISSSPSSIRLTSPGPSGGTNAPAYAESIASVDVEVGKIIDAVDERAAKTGEKWTVVVTADQGHTPIGGHDGQSDAEATTFVIARGAGYAAGQSTADYMIADITPTVLQSLNVALPAGRDGKPLAKEAPGFVGSIDLGFFGS